VKQTFYIFFVLWGLCCLTIGCRKKNDALFDGVNCTGNCYILTGTLIDSAAGTGISGARLQFYFNEHRGGGFGAKKILLGQTISSSTGQYQFRFDGSRFARVHGWYTAEAFKDDLFNNPLTTNEVALFNLDSTHYNIPLVQQLILFRPATLKIRVIASTITNFQFLTLGYSYGKGGVGHVLNGGRNIDTILNFKTAGDLRSFIQADARGNGVNISLYDTLVIPARSTRQIEMRF
jgi:hypothetical protein